MKKNLHIISNNLFKNHTILGIRTLTNSWVCLDHIRLHTWLPVSILCFGWPVRVFQNLIWRSAVPPPLAKRPCSWGDHAIAEILSQCQLITQLITLLLGQQNNYSIWWNRFLFNCFTKYTEFPHLWLLLYVVCRSEQVKGSGNSTHEADCHCLRKLGIACQETI